MRPLPTGRRHQAKHSPLNGSLSPQLAGAQGLTGGPRAPSRLPERRGRQVTGALRGPQCMEGDRRRHGEGDGGPRVPSALQAFTFSRGPELGVSSAGADLSYGPAKLP